jgi:hypothetical protein
MTRTRVATPAWVKVVAATVALTAAAWWLVDRHDRLGNQARLGDIASAIAERPVRVTCPGPVGRLLGWDPVAGSVRFDAHGRPGDVAELRTQPCAELDALAEGRRGELLACGAPCMGQLVDLTSAVGTLAHEAWHLRGIRDEGETECRAMGSLAWTAERLGAAPAEAALLARVHREVVYPQLGEVYRGGNCASSA